MATDYKTDNKAACQKCKRWKECIGKAYYDYSEIKYCPYQILWILEHAVTLLSGEWPDNCSGNPEAQTSRTHEASFVKPEITIGDVERRMKTTGWVGVSLRERAEQGFTIDQLSSPEYNVLMYLKGKKEKLQTYSQWRRNDIMQNGVAQVEVHRKQEGQ